MKVIIDGVLATDGIGDLGYDYINDKYNGPEFYPPYQKIYLGFDEFEVDPWPVLDVRTLLDESGNALEQYQELIEKGCQTIDEKGRVLVCCTAGISRSNAIAAGILMKNYRYSYQDALDKVHEKVKIDLIENAHLNALKELEEKWNDDYLSELHFDYY